MSNQLLQAAKHALEFIQSIDGYENSKTASELRQAIEAAEQERAVDVLPCGHTADNLVVNAVTSWCDACESGKPLTQTVLRLFARGKNDNNKRYLLGL